MSDAEVARGRADTDARLKAVGPPVSDSMFCSAAFTVMTQRFL